LRTCDKVMQAFGLYSLLEEEKITAFAKTTDVIISDSFYKHR